MSSGKRQPFCLGLNVLTFTENHIKPHDDEDNSPSDVHQLQSFSILEPSCRRNVKEFGDVGSAT